MSVLHRGAVHALLARIRSGRIELREKYSGTAERFGPADASLSAVIKVHDPRFYDALAWRRSVGLGESYAEGLWDSPDLVDLLRIGARELFRLDPTRRRLAPLARPFHRLMALPLLNTRGGARRNAAAHYDLGNEMFETFLDTESMMYSSACFEDEGQSLEDAQRHKLERICAALELSPRDHLVEIGTGWGGFAVYAAQKHGCRVTTTTISREQREYAENRVRAAGLEGLVSVIDADYRTLEGRFDKLASIEMIEAVGWEYFALFFRRCSELLTPNGLMFLQAICIDDRAYEAEKSTRSFANQLIFPGGCLPSVEQIHHCLATQTDMRDVWLEDISPSYALTLRAWGERFTAASAQLEQLGYDRGFRRLWELYFAISEAGFRESRLSDVQMLCAKRGWTGRVPSRPSRHAITVGPAREDSPSSSTTSSSATIRESRWPWSSRSG
jgi:cyclopropane-fatty-acyl-phospholipid synthase